MEIDSDFDGETVNLTLTGDNELDFTSLEGETIDFEDGILLIGFRGDKLSIDFDGDNLSPERIGEVLLVLLTGEDGISNVSESLFGISLRSLSMALRICANGTVETIGLLILGADEVLARRRESCFFVDGSNFSMNLKIMRKHYLVISSFYLFNNSGVRSLKIKNIFNATLLISELASPIPFVKTFSTAFSQIF